MNMRGWLASGLLAAAVIGGYLGLLPMLSSLASGPAWPEPIASREASGVVTAVGPAGGATPDSSVPAVQDDETSEVVGNAKPRENGNTRAKPAVVEDTARGALVRVEQPKKKAPVTGSGSASNSSSSGGGSSSGGSAATTPNNGGNGSAQPRPQIPVDDPLDGLGSGDLAGGNSAADNSADDVTAGG
jgi:hypothetical protein